MKSLDEVIEIASDWTNGFDEMSIEKQMLYYLKEYKEKQKTLEIKAAEYKRGFEQLGVEWSRIKENPPLSWDELKTMEGKPVWIELLGKGKWKGWDVIGGFDDDDFGFAMCTVRGDDYYLADLGKTWQAYRKERK